MNGRWIIGSACRLHFTLDTKSSIASRSVHLIKRVHSLPIESVYANMTTNAPLVNSSITRCTPSLRSKWPWACLLVVALSVIPYLSSLTGTVIWEDERLLRDADCSLRTALSQPFLGAYFRPATSLSFWIDHRLWGAEPFMYHQTNIAIHALTTVFLIAALCVAFRSRAIAAVGGALFALQPVQVSAVAWIGGRTDSLCALFVSMFIWALISGVRSERFRLPWLSTGAAFFFVAMLTKEQAIVLLPLVPLAHKCFGSGDSTRGWRRTWLVTAIFATVATTFLVLAYTIGAGLPPTVPHDLSYRLTIFGRTVTYYSILLLLPSQRWMHTETLMSLEAAGPVTVLSGYCILATAALVFWRLLRTKPAAAWFLGFAVLAILPVSNFIPVSSLVVAPYRAGIAGLGIAGLTGWLLAPLLASRKDFLNGLRHSKGRNALSIWAGWVVVAVAVGWCGALTFWGTTKWSDEDEILGAYVRYDPGSYFVRQLRHKSLIRVGQPDLAEKNASDYLSAIYGSNAWTDPRNAVLLASNDKSIMDRLYSSLGDKRRPMQALADWFVMLGYARQMAAKYEGTLLAFRTGEALDGENPNVMMALGRWFCDRKDWTRAAPYLVRVIEVNPRIILAQMLYGKCLAHEGKFAEAEQAFRTAEDLQPWDWTTYYALADVQMKRGDRIQAVRTLKEGLSRSMGGKENLSKLLMVASGGTGGGA